MLATGRYASAFDLWKEMDVEPSILVRLSYQLSALRACGAFEYLPQPSATQEHLGRDVEPAVLAHAFLLEDRLQRAQVDQRVIQDSGASPLPPPSSSSLPTLSATEAVCYRWFVQHAVKRSYRTRYTMECVVSPVQPQARALAVKRRLVARLTSSLSSAEVSTTRRLQTGSSLSRTSHQPSAPRGESSQ
jgi:hypothetical protein